MNAMKKTPNINPESQDVAELQAMVKELLALQKTQRISVEKRAPIAT